MNGEYWYYSYGYCSASLVRVTKELPEALFIPWIFFVRLFVTVSLIGDRWIHTGPWDSLMEPESLYPAPLAYETTSNYWLILTG